MIAPPQCFLRKCSHYIGIISDSLGDEISERPACTAYPNGIPDDIAYGNLLHLEVRSDQNNDIVFDGGE